MINKIREIKERRLGKWGLILCNILDVMEKNVTSDVDFYTYNGHIAIKHFKHVNVIHLNTIIFDTENYEDIANLYTDWKIIEKILNQRFPNTRIFTITEQKPKRYVVLGDKIVEYDYIRKIKL